MEKGFPKVLFSFLQGGGIATSAMAIARYNKMESAKEAILIAVAVLLIAAALFVFSRYKIGNKLNPGITNPKVVNFLTKYPMAGAYFSLCTGIITLSVLFHFLDKF
jgi:uncharacterized membrane protein YidH (DUF202 family)